MKLSYPIFDGQRTWDGATVTVEDGLITSVVPCSKEDCSSGYFLMPGLIDCHTHIKNRRQLEALARSGVTSTCDVCAPKALHNDTVHIHTSAIMAMGDVEHGAVFVEQALREGAQYIKVILEEPARMALRTMPKEILQQIVLTAHSHGLKVAAHAVTQTMIRMAVETGVDILIHVSMKEPFPLELVQKIAAQKICVVPTLIMMKGFSKSLIFGYRKEHYANAAEAVRLMQASGIPIAAGTDSHDVIVLPPVHHGASMHQELELLVEAGLTPVQALSSATATAADTFGLQHIGRIAQGYRANLILVEGRPDQNIADIRQIRRVWIDGTPISAED